MQQNSDVINETGILSELVYMSTYTGDVFNSDDHPQLQKNYTVVATQANDSGFQGMLLRDDTGNYVFAFRGTEADHPMSNWEQFYKDHLIADFAYMGSGNVPQQMKDAMLFVKEMMDEHEAISASNTVFTGHSLGGAIAGRKKGDRSIFDICCNKLYSAVLPRQFQKT